MAAVDARRSARRQTAIETVRSSARVRVAYSWRPDYDLEDLDRLTADAKPGDSLNPRKIIRESVAVRNDGPALATGISFAVVGPKNSWSKAIAKLDPGEAEESVQDLTETALKNEPVTLYLEWYDALATRYVERWEFRRRSVWAAQGNIVTGVAASTRWWGSEVPEPAARQVIPADGQRRPWWRFWWAKEAQVRDLMTRDGLPSVADQSVVISSATSNLCPDVAR